MGAHKRLGKSYTVLSTNRAKLALPVMSKKRSGMDTPFKTNIMEIALASNEEVAQQVFITAAVYTALIIIKTMFEAVGRLFIALYGHGFCGYMRSEMFRRVLRHGAAYFDEEANTPGRLAHKLISDTTTLNRVSLLIEINNSKCKPAHSFKPGTQIIATGGHITPLIVHHLFAELQ
ncbi:unnamed protein product [Gongylonema pulchrum]|uniref:ABC transmembrane type-1 domain-containing protein n=1 Tax=Gongylonema pulchrum TaxID=637853 RepID=A0A3P7N7Z6_9BILA|nr:unnamed protein product [Gongylonema pulchrum]